MTIYAINGSPRKNFTTAQLLDSFKKGAESVSETVEVKAINLYDLHYTGCRECYLCKLKGGKSFGKCGYRDEITQLLDDIAHADGLAIGAPIFFGDFNAQTKAFLERLMFPFLSYDGGSLAPKKLPTAFFSAMNVPEETMRNMYMGQFNNTLNFYGFVMGGAPETCYANNTYQFTDYSKYAAGMWNEEEKRRWREEQFPKDCQRAFEIGKTMAEKAINAQEVKG